MKQTLAKALNLYPSELFKISSFALLAFCWSYSVSMSLTLFDGLFLEHLGASELPKAYALSSLSVIATSFWLFREMKKKPLSKIFKILLISQLTIYFLFFFSTLMVPKLPNWVFFLFRIISTIGLAVNTTAFWSFTDQHFDLQDAKRIYAILFSCLFLGAITSNFSISLLFHLIGYGGLGGFISLGYFISVFFVAIIDKKIVLAHDDTSDGSDVVGISAKELIFNILTSKYTIALTVFAMLSEMIWNMTEFNYLSEFQAYFQAQDPTRFETDPRLIEFLATSKGFIAFGNVFLALFMYSRIVQKVGINKVLYIPFILFFITYTFWVGFSNLVIGTIGLVLVEGVLYTFGDNNYSILLHGTSQKIRIPYRVVSASFLEPLSVFFTALFLSIPFFNTIIVGFFIVSFTLINVFILNSYYKKAILDNLNEINLNFTRPIHTFFKNLNNKQKQSINKTLKKATGDPYFIFTLIGQTQSKKAQIEYLSTLDDDPFFSLLSLLEKKEDEAEVLSHPDLVTLLEEKEHKKAYYFLSKAKKLPLKKASTLLKKNDLTMKKASIITLLFTHEHTEAIKVFNALFESEKVEEILASFDVIRAFPQLKNAQDLLPFLKNSELFAFTMETIRSLKRLDHFSAIEILKAIQLSNEPENRIKGIEALFYQLTHSILKQLLEMSLYFTPSEKRAIEKLVVEKGLCLTGPLLSILKQPDELNVQLLAGRCLGNLSISLLRQHLEEILNTPIKQAYFRFFCMHTIEEKRASEDVNLLKEALSVGFDKLLDFIIQMLSISGEIENPELLVYSLKSSNEKIQAYAVETLEKSTSPNIFKRLEFLIDDRPVVEKLHLCVTFDPLLKNIQLDTIIGMLKKSNQLIDQLAITLYLKEHHFDESKEVILKHFDNPFFQPFALEVLKN